MVALQEVGAAKLQAKSQSWTHSCMGTKAKQWVVMAPLLPPNSQAIRYATLDTWTLLVVELEGTPPNWRLDFDVLWDSSALAHNKTLPNLVFLDRQSQRQLGFASGSRGITSNARSRNVGSLFAIKYGATVILEADESLEQKKGTAGELTVQPIDSGPFPQAQGDLGARIINPYGLFGHPDIWPAGFPLAAVANATFEFRSVQDTPPSEWSAQPLMQLALVDDYPVTDAALRLTQEAHRGPRRFIDKPAAVGVQPGHFAPLPLGSTAFHRGAFWAAGLLSGHGDGLAPVARSLWAQKLLWSVGGQLVIAAPHMRRNRTEQSQDPAALQQEVEAQAAVAATVQFLQSWGSSEGALHEKMLSLARGLQEAGLWAQEEVENMAAWVADLRAVGYEFPAAQALEGHPVVGERGAPVKKLAAFCLTGQADRSAEAIPDSLSSMQKLLTAHGSSQEALQLAQTVEHWRAEDGGIVFAHDTFAYVSTHESCGDHIRWVAQQRFTYSILYNDPLLEVPHPLDPTRFGGNAVVPMLYQMHAQQRCWEMVGEFSRQHGVEYSVIVRLRTDHRIEGMAEDTSAFALWSNRSLTSVIIPQPRWDFSDIMPKTGGYQDRIGWGPTNYMQKYMSRWSQFFNRTHMESDAPFHGESSLRHALTTAGVPVERLEDDQLQYLEVQHNNLKCAVQEAQRGLE